MGDETTTWVIYVVILAIAGLFQLVKKAVEKASAGKEGEKIDLGDAVRERLRRYMRKEDLPPQAGEAEGRGTGAGPATAPRPVAAPVMPRPVVLPRPPKVEAPRQPALRKPLVVRRKRRAKGELLKPTAAASVAVVQMLSVSKVEIRKAILMAELLGPPVAERKDYRLF